MEGSAMQSHRSEVSKLRQRLAAVLATLALIAGAPTVTVMATAGPAKADSASEIGAALSWAEARLNQSVYYGLCLQFVADAYNSAGVNIGSANSAVDYWNGHTGHHTDIDAPEGALVFWG